jgi:hypothetical protein
LPFSEFDVSVEAMPKKGGGITHAQ